MEKFEKLMLSVTIILLIILGSVFFYDVDNVDSLEEYEVRSSNSKRVYESKVGQMGAVRVEVTPISSSEYEISLNTHSVELSFDFMQIITLEDDLGTLYKALSWSGENGGHHLIGVIEFDEISTQAKNATITITDIESKVLSLSWNL